MAILKNPGENHSSSQSLEKTVSAGAGASAANEDIEDLRAIPAFRVPKVSKDRLDLAARGPRDPHSQSHLCTPPTQAMVSLAL